jgi:hypothetical protein
MEIFYTGFAASLIAAIVFHFIAIMTGYLKWNPFKLYRKIGIVKIFKNQETASKAILDDIKKSDFIEVLAMKGSTFSSNLIPNTRDKNPLCCTSFSGGKIQRYLISSLESPYLKERAKNLEDSKKEFNLITNVGTSIGNFTRASTENANIHFLLHEETVLFRIILLKDFLYLSFQKEDMLGRESPILKIEESSPMYKNFSLYFDGLWKKYSELPVTPVLS